MKAFLTALLLFTGLLAHAQQEADTQYLGIYGTIQAAEKYATDGQPREALTAYTEAQTRLDQFQKTYPEWNPSIVAFRLHFVSGKIAELKNRAPAIAPAPTKPLAPAEAAARIQSQVEDLTAQLQAAQAENTSLQAKLKEALATQPATVDAAELAHAQEQIRELLKENELLKAQPATTGKSSAADSAAKKHAKQLAEENDQLRQELKLASNNTAALATLREENVRLQNQIASLTAAARNDTATELKKAHELIASLRTAVANATDEAAALSKKNHDLLHAAGTAGYEKSLRQITEERDSLQKQLAAATQKKSRTNDKTASADVTALNQQIETLRAWLAVAEAEKIPFTTEELAMLRSPAPAPAPATAAEALPAGTAELAASARQHFERHEYAEASSDYRKILEKDAGNAVALANLATIELQQENLADAEKHILAALAQKPNDAYNLSTLGSLKFHQEKYDEALDALSRSAALDPSNPETQNYLGVTLGQKGRRTEAESAFRKALLLNAAYAPAHNNLAMIYLNQPKPAPQLARWHYQKALAAGQPRNPELEKALAAKGAPVDAP